jgi:alkaline phosphatase
MSFRKSLLSLLIVSLAGCQLISPSAIQPPKPKNIILFIGDGMGPAYMKAYRLFKDDPDTVEVENSLFDGMFVGLLRTDPIGAYGSVTESAASATAMATGVKTYKGAISVDVNDRPLLTVLEVAKQQGLSTGLIATSSISHATPAAFASHQKSRKNENTIVDQYIDNRFNGQPYVDILLGGGKAYFEREDRNISKEFKALGYHLVDNRTTLKANHAVKILGLFSQQQMPKMIDREDAIPSLAEMTMAAIKQLSKNDKGFFLMIEASQIDWAGHDQDIVGVMSEMQDLEAAVLVATAFADEPDHSNTTQILITADHSTGGLSVGSEVNGKNYYQWNAKAIQGIKYTPEKIIKRALVSQDLVGEFSKATGFQLTDKEKHRIEALNFEQFSKNDLDITAQDYLVAEKVNAELCQIISDRSYTGWTTHGHTGEDVHLFAYGPASRQLQGNWENTRIGQVIFEWLLN